jgi:hypothetical protein
MVHPSYPCLYVYIATGNNITFNASQAVIVHCVGWLVGLKGVASSESEASSDSEPSSTATVMAVRTYVDAPLYSLREIEQEIRADDQHNHGQTSRRALEISVLLPLIEAIQEVELDVSPL